MLVAEKGIRKERLVDLRERLGNRVTDLVKMRTEHLERTARRLQDPRKRLADSWMRLDELYGRIAHEGESLVREKRKALDGEKRALYSHSPLRLVSLMRQEKAHVGQALIRAGGIYLKGRKTALSMLGKQLKGLSPLSILRRGYSITMALPERNVIRKASSIGGGDLVEVLLGEGRLECRVEKASEQSGIVIDREDIPYSE
jgi:exodeoxyribonuclease VII large subunit